MVEIYAALRRAVPARRRGRLRRADAAQLRAAARQRRRCASTTSGASATSWSTSSRTPTSCSTPGCKMFAGPPSSCACSRSATTTRASTPSAARRSATWPTSSASSRSQHLIKLEQNYRCYGNILDAANALIAHNKHAPGQEPAHRGRARASRCACTRRPPTSPRRSGSSRKRSSCMREGTPRSEIALLYRSNAQSRVIETRAVQRRHAVPRLRRPALLRARRDQARARLPAPDREPERRHQLPARRQLPAARHRRAHASSSCRTRRARAAAALHERRRGHRQGAARNLRRLRRA